MTEETDLNPSGTPAAPPEAADVPPHAPPSKPKKADDTPKRYAAYDRTYLRFVGEVHDNKTAATKEARDRKVKDFEIREV